MTNSEVSVISLDFALIEHIVHVNDVQSDCQYVNAPLSSVPSDNSISFNWTELDHHDSLAAVASEGWDGPGTEERGLSGQGQSEFGHGYVEVVPRTHPQFIFV